MDMSRAPLEHRTEVAVRVLLVSFILHVVCLAAFQIIALAGVERRVRPVPYEVLGNVAGWASGVFYIIALGGVWAIRSDLHKAGVYALGPWPWLLAAVVLNPCACGWLIPLWVLLDIPEARRRIQNQGNSGTGTGPATM